MGKIRINRNKDRLEREAVQGACGGSWRGEAIVVADTEFVFDESNGQPALDEGAFETEMINAV